MIGFVALLALSDVTMPAQVPSGNVSSSSVSSNFDNKSIRTTFSKQIILEMDQPAERGIPAKAAMPCPKNFHEIKEVVLLLYLTSPSQRTPWDVTGSIMSSASTSFYTVMRTFPYRQKLATFMGPFWRKLFRIRGDGLRAEA